MLALLDAFILIMGAAFITYVILITVPYVRRKAQPDGDSSEYGWHFLIPCLNEEAVIKETINRARATFPESHVWIIDDDSDDATAEITANLMNSDSRIHLIQRRQPNARTGKGAALNAAFNELNAWLSSEVDRDRIVVAVIDADGELAANALSAVAGKSVFGDLTVGAAQISVWMRNRNDPKPYPDRGRLANAFGQLLVRMQDLEFRTVIEGMQALRSKTGTVGLGGNGQFTRLSTLDEIAKAYGTPWHGALLEDYELGVHVSLLGYRVVQVRETHVTQEGLPSLRRLLRQRTRWAQGNMQCTQYLRDIIRSPYFSAAGVLESCYYLLLPFIQLLCLLAIFIVMGVDTVLAIINPGMLQVRVESLPFALLVVLIFAIGPFVFWGPIYRRFCEPELTFLQSVGLGLSLAVYNLHVVAVQAPALFRIVFRRTSWAKTRRNGEVSDLTPQSQT